MSKHKMKSQQDNMIRYMGELVRRHEPERLFPIVLGEKGSLLYLLTRKNENITDVIKGGNPIAVNPIRLGIIRVGERLELALGMVNKNSIASKVMTNLKETDEVFRKSMKESDGDHTRLIWNILNLRKPTGLRQILSAIEFQNEDYDVSLIKKKLKELTVTDVKDSEDFLSEVKRICGD